MTTIRNYINPEVLEVDDTDGKLVVKFRADNPSYNPVAEDAPQFIYENMELDELEEQRLFIEDLLSRQDGERIQGDTESFRNFYRNISNILEQAYSRIYSPEKDNQESGKTYTPEPPRIMNPTRLVSALELTLEECNDEHFFSILESAFDLPADMTRIFALSTGYERN